MTEKEFLLLYKERRNLKSMRENKTDRIQEECKGKGKCLK